MPKPEDEIDKLSMIQGVAILLTAISVFDFGYANYVDRGIWFNFVLFETQDPTFLSKNTFWDIFQFWGYCFIVVAISQILKSLPKDFTLRPNSLKFGKVSISIFFGAPVISLLIASKEYDFERNAISSLVDYGWLPTVMMSWGLMISMVNALVYFYFLDVTQKWDRIAIGLLMAASIMFFLTGLTLPNDQPFSHNTFGNSTWYLSALGIFLYSISKRSESLTSLVFAGLIFIFIFSMVLLDYLGINIVLWFTQASFGFLLGIWFVDYEIRMNRSNSKLHE